MDIIKELEQRNAERDQCILEIQNLEKEKAAELEILKKQLMDKYAKKMMSKHQELREYNSSIDAYCKTVQAYSCFDDLQLGNALADIVSAFESERYVYQDTYCTTKEKAIRSRYNWIENDIKKYIKILVLENVKLDHYADKDIINISEREARGEIIILDSDDEVNKETISFYKTSTYERKIKMSGNLERYPYIKEFMNMVIGYKMEHQILDLSNEEMHELVVEFLEMKAPDITLRHREKQYRKLFMN